MSEESSETKTQPDLMGNIGPTKKQVKASIDIIQQRIKERGEINADINAEREKCAALGVPRRVLAQVIRELEQDAEQRKNDEIAYHIAREAAGIPLQGNLFD